MKEQQVYIEVNIDSLTPSQRSNIIKSRWVLRDKGNNVRARIVAKRLHRGSKQILTRSMPQHPSFAYYGHFSRSVCNNGWIVRTGDISTAFLHASAATQDFYM